jgi:hypothetical protein
MTDLSGVLGSEHQPPGSATVLEKLLWSLSSESQRAYQLLGYALAALFAIVALDLILLGAAPITEPWDVAALLDGGWRIVCGQAPYSDFHSPLGPLEYLLIAFGMRVAAPSTSSICYGTVLLAAVLLPWAWWIVRRRLPAVIAFVLVVFLGILLVSPRPLAYAVRSTSYAMIYNREGYVLLSMFLVGLFLKPRKEESSSPALEGFSSGALLALMLYCKVSYFLAAAASLPIGAIVYRRNAVWLVNMALAILSAALILNLVFHISTHAYLADVANAGRSQSLNMRAHLLIEYGESASAWIYLLMICMSLWISVDRVPRRKGLWGVLPSAITIWVVVVAFMCDIGNAAQSSDDPMYVVAAVLLVELSRRRHATDGRIPEDAPRRLYVTSIILMLPMFAAGIFFKDAASLGYATFWNLGAPSHFDASRYLHSEHLRDFRVPQETTQATNYWPSRDYPANMNDGIDLLRKRLHEGDRVTTLGFTNPFSFAMNLPPARDGNQFWVLNVSFDKRHALPASEVLGNTSVVMIPRMIDRSREADFEAVDALVQLYGDYLQRSFILVDSSREWSLYRRRM